MATIRFFPSEGAPVLLALHKPLSTIGRALGNDIHLPDASVAIITRKSCSTVAISSSRKSIVKPRS